MTLQTTHNTATTTLQRELDKLRQEHQQIKVQLRELEMGNDDLERNERAVSSSLADIEAKYSKALEEKIILEQEIIDKANLEEETQRLKDELRDANVEISILKDQLAAQTRRDFGSIAPSSRFSQATQQSEDDLLKTEAPDDLQLEDLTPSSSDSLPSASGGSAVEATPKAKVHSAFVGRSGAVPFRSHIATPPSSSGIARSTALPSLYSSSPRASPSFRPSTARNPSAVSTNSTSSTTSKSKGVQMVSEMRARVRNLEQKIHTRVPRLRMGSITRPSPASGTSTATNSTVGSTSSKTSVRTSWESLTSTSRRSGDPPKPTSDSDSDKIKKGRESAGWVLIMEDSPSPPKPKPGERRRPSSPLDPIPYRPAASTSMATGTPKPMSPTNPLNQSMLPTSGLRRPQSRLSSGSATISIPSSSSSSSRPSTPTFLPVPTAGLYAHQTTAGLTGLKRPTGSASTTPYAKRSSLGASTAAMPPPPLPKGRPMTMPPSVRPNSEQSDKTLPQLPGHANVTIRPAKSISSAALGQSRIGRPSSGRRSRGDDGPRPRSGSTAM
ncbi:unnamed protein product [Mycena citricolor]|uniref:NUDE domain-containing protein n=1 Tax=Mycena citricolor TaxID=2018698 RepID=A0AAD2K6W4_9AGAR|nr:unnamed protein product [Mycena citricolor]